MYVIVVYDVNVKRVAKICQFLRRYLNWIQNSVFEGELTESELKKVEIGIKKVIDTNEDSVIIYQLRSEDLVRKDHIGIKKVEPTSII